MENCVNERGVTEHVRASYQRYGWTLVLFLLATLPGCNRGPAVVPVTGKVVYNGNPLGFGSVTFQPTSGQQARGEIQADGSFQLSTFSLNDGAVPGAFKVKVACYDSQNPKAAKAAGEQGLGKLLIPRKFTTFNTSGLTADVKESGNEPFVFELTGAAN